MKNYSLTALAVLFTMPVLAQNNTQEDLIPFMRSSGRIYVVVAVMLIILIGLFIFLVRLDRKMKKMERTGFPE